MVLYDDPQLNEQQSYSHTEAVRRLPFPDNVAAAVLLVAIHDLKSGNPKLRADARLALDNGSLHWWLEHMSLSSRAFHRVRLLLEELGRR